MPGGGGIGSLRHGVRHNADIQMVQHAYGTNSHITALDFRQRPATDWRHVIALFDGCDATLRAALSAHAAGLDCYLLSVVERRFARFHRRLEGIFPPDRDAVFAMVAPDAMADFTALVALAGGRIALDKSLTQITAANLPPPLRAPADTTPPFSP